MSNTLTSGSEQIYSLSPLEPSGNNSDTVLGYYLKSTATIDVEDVENSQNDNERELKTIAEYFTKSHQPELVLHIHGYANTENSARQRYQEAYDYAKSAAANLNPGNYIFIGYRWPSENPKQDDPLPGRTKRTSFLNKIVNSFQALPNLPLGILITCLAFSFTSILLAIQVNLAANFLINSILIIAVSSIFWLLITRIGRATKFLPIFPNGIILVISLWVFAAFFSFIIKNPYPWLILVTIVLVWCIGVLKALIILRLVTYPRDRFRAINYGVLDLVRFFQDLQNAILEEYKNQNNKTRIKISFIAHSLGSEVATQTIRILSDVFDHDPQSEQPSSNIGDVFTLGRLVLVAPDIPVESILTSRANFLKSSLRRCEEAYVFSNEGDLALRLASTTANYFSFPSRTRFRGYKLGNITFDRRAYRQNLQLSDYGIVNCDDGNFDHPRNPHELLEIRASSIERKPLTDEEVQNQSHTIEIADYLTYFDCTDYQEIPNVGMVSFAKKQSALNFIDYLRLSIAYFLNYPRPIDVHGGYFNGEFCQTLINELAFIGYQGVLLKYLPSMSQPINIGEFDSLLVSEQNELFEQFSQACQDKYIQVILASKSVPNSNSDRVIN